MTIVNVILRRGQQGPMNRFMKSIFCFSAETPLSIYRNYPGQSDVDHFVSFAELYRAVKKGYDLAGPASKIATIHHLDKRRKHKTFSAIFQSLDLITVVSNEWKRHLLEIEGVPPYKVKVIYNGYVAKGMFQEEAPPPDGFYPRSLEIRQQLRQEFCIPEDAFVVGHVGREHEPRKDCQTFYEALDILGKEVFPVFFESSQYPSAISGLNMLGFHRYGAYYNLFDCFVISAGTEGGPLSFIESIQSGVPVIGTPVGVVKDFSCPEFVVPFRDPKELARKILDVKNRYPHYLEKTLKMRDELAWMDYLYLAREFYGEYQRLADQRLRRNLNV